MKTSNKVGILLFVAIICLTEYYRSTHQSPIEYSARLLALDPSTVQTTSTRSTNVADFCGGFTKSTLISSTDKETNSGYFKTLKSYFPIDANDLVTAAVKQDTTALASQAQAAGTGLGVYVAPFIIGLILVLIIWSCLCCCCTCPSCCPSKCCQKPDEELYTKCELLWPAITLILLLLLAIAAAVPGITKSSTFGDSIKTMQCGVSFMLDDFLNGNISNNGNTYFAGIATLTTKLTDLANNVDQVSTQFGAVKTALNTVLTKASTATTNLPTVASSTANATMANLVYTNTMDSTTNSLASIIPSVIGSPSTNNSVMWGFWVLHNQLYWTLKPAYDQIDAAITATSGGAGSNAMSSSITSAKTQVDSFVTLVQNADTGAGSAFSTVNSASGALKSATMGFFAAVIGLSVIALLGVVIMACFDKAGCRHLMYLACVLMWLVCIIGFLIAFVFSILIPILYFSCTVINAGLSSSANLASMTNTFNLNASYSNYLGVCLEGGTGEIMAQFGGSATIQNQINNVSGSMSFAYAYKDYDMTALNTNKSTLQTSMDNLLWGATYDIASDTTMSDYIKKLGDNTLVASTICNATTGVYATDSLVPSLETVSKTNFPCRSSVADQTTCTSFDTTNCVTGCIDLYDIFELYRTNTAPASEAAMATDLNTRYGATCGAEMFKHIDKLYTAWHKPRIAAFGPVYTSYTSGVKTQTDDVVTGMSSVKTSLGNALTSLNSVINLLNPTTGLIAGLNCLVLGEDLVLAKDTLCVSMFNSFYFIFVTVGTTSFALLFSLCCIVCSGVRHYKQDNKKNGMKTFNDRSFNEKR